MYKREKARSEFVVASGNTAKFLELEEEVLHNMAFFILPPINMPRVNAVLPGRNAEICAAVGDVFSESPLSVRPIRDHSRSLQLNSAEQFFRDRDVAGVSGRQHDLDRIAQGIHDNMNFRAPAASAHANALIGLRPVLTISQTSAICGFLAPPLSWYPHSPCVP